MKPEVSQDSKDSAMQSPRSRRRAARKQRLRIAPWRPAGQGRPSRDAPGNGLEIHPSADCLSLRSARRYLFTGAEDYLVQRWNVADGTSTPLTGHESWVRAIGFSPDGATTFTGGFDGRLIWWSTAADKPSPLAKVDAHLGWIRRAGRQP